MAYDDSSYIGDIITKYYYDIENNLMNPESPAGFYLYKVVGGSFDKLYSDINQFRIDMNIIETNVGDNVIIENTNNVSDWDKNKTYYITAYSDNPSKYNSYVSSGDGWSRGEPGYSIVNNLDKFWGKSHNLERPLLKKGEKTRYCSDNEYKAYIYLRTHRLLTVTDLLTCFKACFDTEDVFFSTEVEDNKSIFVVTHYSYDDPVLSNVSLHKYDAEDTDCVTNHLSEEDTNVLVDYLSVGDVITLHIPNAGWDPAFLRFLESFISVRGNVRIKQDGG